MIKFIEDKELCIKLKEKGFDEGCILQFRGEDTQPLCQMDYKLNYEKNSDYEDETNYWLVCPTYDQVCEWLREKHKIQIALAPIRNGVIIYQQVNLFIDGERKKLDIKSTDYDSQLKIAIEEALKLI